MTDQELVVSPVQEKTIEELLRLAQSHLRKRHKVLDFPKDGVDNWDEVFTALKLFASRHQKYKLFSTKAGAFLTRQCDCHRDVFLRKAGK
jgi:hypothetical protein